MTKALTKDARIGIVSPWASRLGGGVFEAIVAHSEMVRSIGFEPVVVALHDDQSANDRERFGRTEVITVPVVGPSMFGFAPSLVKTLLAEQLDLLHLHGIWMYPSAAASQWSARTRRPYLISPHGMTDPWIIGRGKLKKMIARLGYENTSWARASMFHALTDDEANDIREATGRTDSLVIPNAIMPCASEVSRKPIAAFVGRIHPKKNLDGLIEGWVQARDVLRPIGAELWIAGWGSDSDVGALISRISEVNVGDIKFLGPTYGTAKSDLINTASFIALPSHSEGLPVAILEAWASATPTIMSRHCHLSEGFLHGAALDSGTEAKGIAESLRLAFSMPEKSRRQMGLAAYQLVTTRFAPEIVSERWRDAYSGLLTGSSK